MLFHWRHKKEKEDVDLATIFDFSTITSATNHFSNKNKIGEGGFGPVYKVKSLFITNLIYQLNSPRILCTNVSQIINRAYWQMDKRLLLRGYLKHRDKELRSSKMK